MGHRTPAENVTNAKTVYGGAIFYRRIICPVCKQKARVPIETVYRRGDNVFCSYSCLRKYDRMTIHGRPPKGVEYTEDGHYLKHWKDSPRTCRERITNCKRKIREFEAKLAEINYAEQKNRYKCVQESVYRWRYELQAAEEYLKVLEGRRDDS